MERQAKIKLLEAIQNGNIEAIARPLPMTWAKRYPKEQLLNEVKTIYGTGAKIIQRKGQYYVINAWEMPMWHFMTDENGTVSYGSYGKEQTFTQAEFESIISDLQKEDSMWIETKCQTRVINWVHQPGNEPLEADWDWTGAGDTQTKKTEVAPAPDPPKQAAPVKPFIAVQREVEDLHEVKEPEPEEQETIRLSTWEPKRSADDIRREKMNEWKQRNQEFL
jgi:hypothetical protein